MKYLLTIAYNGRNYCGYQVQKNGLSIQEMLGRAAERTFGVPCAITGCSRTDSGVHARDFKATLVPEEGANRIPVDKIATVMNAALPEDIAVLSAVCVADAFHPRYDVMWKEYVYTIQNHRERDPFSVGLAWHIPRRLDEAVMQQAATAFLGTHDFSALMAAGSDIVDPVRTIYRCDVTRYNDTVTVSVAGNGFLYHMVRILVGTLVAVSEGKLIPQDIPTILASRDRARAGMTAPACGLCLNRVSYQPIGKEEFL
ncbi:MAG: tRNA pseudouridine(38-40) synthase TruA [Ruminococcaceae bacterium]|nr:tRNA pseudouridine(38-40) synthase TruA [Oscillospiraceae bacterium]